MFRKSRRKIVAAIMSILAILWMGTLGVIYISSYVEMTNQNRRMLQVHTQMYTLLQTEESTKPPTRPFFGGAPEAGFAQTPEFRLSTFYSVALSYDGKVLEVRNQPSTVYTDAQLESLAIAVKNTNKTSGTIGSLAYYQTQKEGYWLVAFMDNTVVNKSAMTLFRYTLIFGGLALVAFFFLSVFLAKKIVAPLEESHLKQKQFISDAGHELKTPVSVVSANAELLSRELGDNPWLANIQYENRRMAVLVGQLLELARTEAVTPTMEVVDFSRLVAGESLPFESVAFEKGLTLQCEIQNNLQVCGNSSQLKQIVAILLDNAIRHSQPQGQVFLALRQEHGAVKLSVKNQGDPIPAEQQEQLFERFYRGDPARNSEDSHYGLGLAIAKAITLSHRGHIQVCCEKGFVEFKVQLPAA